MELRSFPSPVLYILLSLIRYVPIPAVEWEVVSDETLGGQSRHTLIVVVLVRMVAIQLVQDFDNIGIGTRSAELVAGAIKAQDELVGLLRPFWAHRARNVGLSVTSVVARA